MQHVRIIESGAILTAQEYRELHPAVAFANDFQPLDDAELLPAEDAPLVVPQRIPMLNAHLELIESGWMDAVRTHIDTLPQPQRAMAHAYLDKAETMSRTNDLVLAIPAAIDKTSAEVDEMFIRAAARIV